MLTMENIPANEDGAEKQAKEHLDVNNIVLPQSTENLNLHVENNSVLPESNAGKGEYSPNEDGTEVPAKEDLNVDNNSVLPQTYADNGESSPNKNGTTSPVTEHLNVEKNSVLPQAEHYQDESTPNEVDMYTCGMLQCTDMVSF